MHKLWSQVYGLIKIFIASSVLLVCNCFCHFNSCTAYRPVHFTGSTASCLTTPRSTMLAAMKASVILTLLILVSMDRIQVVVASCTYVNGSSEVQADSCLNITQALSYIENNIELMLEPGEHVLQNTVATLVSNFTGVSLLGLGQNPIDVNIMCEDGVGLAFWGTNRLTIQNLTIRGCAINSTQMSIIKEYSASTFEEIVSIPDDVRIGIFIGNSFDISIDNVLITDTVGVGLVGFNLLGQTQMSGVFIVNNKPMTTECPKLNFDPNARSEIIGGGIYLLYQDYSQPTQVPVEHSLSIVSSAFNDNQDCSNMWIAELYYGQSDRLRSEGYGIGGGGGLTIMLAQTRYDINAYVNQTTFTNNSAKFGSGAHVGFFTGVDNSSVDFDGCLFLENGNVEQTTPYSGGGLATFIDLARPNLSESVSTPNRSLVLTVSDTNFTTNSARSGGGMYIYSLSASSIEVPVAIKIQQCMFNQNRAPIASALAVFNREGTIFNNLLALEITDCSFVEHDSQFPSGYNVFGLTGITILLARVGSLTLSGSSTFSRNIGTVIASFGTRIYVDGDITIANNTGFAGALRLLDYATLILRQNSRLTFSRNFAAPYGGAIYIGSQGAEPGYLQGDCFLYFQEVDILPQSPGCLDFQTLNISVVFEQNEALQGSVLYGPTLESCNWASCLLNSSSDNRSAILDRLLDMNVVSIIDDPKHEDDLRISSRAVNFKFIDYTEQYVMPGQSFTIDILALDVFNHSIPEGLGSIVVDRSLDGFNERAESRLGPNGFWFVDRSPVNKGSSTPVSITGAQNQTVTVFIGPLDTTSTAFNSFDVKLTTCTSGFFYDSDGRTCRCDNNFTEVGVQCSIDSGNFTVPDNVWIGLVDNKNETLFSYTLCAIDYCKPGPVNITKDNFDFRCAKSLNRNGVGCGGCKANFSSSFGTSRCQECSNYFLFLIIFFMFTGIATMVAMVLLRITITEGYLNSVLFYSNIVNPFTVFFTPLTIGSGAFIPLAWISQNFGIQTCFYDGMTTLVAYSMRFVYVGYLFFIMICATLIAKGTDLPQSSKYSPAKVLATLLILCYSTLLDVCVSVFAFKLVYASDGSVLTRWYYDPNVVYFEGLHGFLFTLALVTTIFFLLPFPICLCSPKLILRIKLFSRFKPLLDPYWAPLKPNFEWWVSFRLIFRWLPVCLSAPFVNPLNSFITFGVCLVCLLFFQMKLQPFVGPVRNLIDDLLLTNVVLLVLGYLYFSSVDNLEGISIYSSVLVAFAYIVFAVILVIHFDLRYPNAKKRIIEWYSSMKQKKSSKPEDIEIPQTSPNNEVTHSEVVVSPRDKRSGSVRFASPDAGEMLGDLKYTRYRESLLGDDIEESTGNIFDRSTTG